MIPEVVKVIDSKRTGQEIRFTMPQHCPVCNSSIVRAEDESALRCINTICSAQVKERIKHFASKGAFDIDGLGDKLVEQLVDKGLLFSYADIFGLNEDMLKNMERMGQKSAANIVDAITKSKQITLARFIYSLGIRHVGEYVAGILATTFGSLEKLICATRDDLTAIQGVGPVVAESIADFFNRDENRNAVNDIVAGGVRILSETPRKQGGLEGKVFVLTGTLETLTRSQAKKIIETAGGKVTGSVSRNTDYLVAGTSPGSKLQRANDLGVDIIDEKTLRRLTIDE